MAVAISMLASSSLIAQNKVTVSGTVSDAQGPVIGASVFVKGTTTGVSTDFGGNYKLEVPSSSTVQISCIGYVTKEFNAGNGGEFNIVLEEDSNLIDELVVVGYATQKKANLTGSVAAVGGKELEDIPAGNSASLIQGRLPGVVLSSTGGQAGKDTPQIRIRGIGTLSDNNDPMVLIDGVEASVSEFAQIAPADIDNISVLKDAASASIYGVRAANGVILVNTKRGSGTPTINYAGSFSLQSASILPDFVNGAEWAKMYNESQKKTVFTEEMIRKIQDGSDPDHFADTNWLDAIFRTAPMHQHNLSVRGGTDKVHYMISAGYLNQEAIMKYTGNERFNFRSNVDAKVGRFTFGMNLAGSKQSLKSNATTSGGDGSIMSYLTWYTRPTVPVYYSNGHLGVVDGTDISNVAFKHPYESMTNSIKTNETYRLDANTFVQVDILPGLTFKTSLAYKLMMNDTSSYSKKSKRYDAEGNVLSENTNNSLSKGHTLNTTILNENILNYAAQFGQHGLNVLAGHSVQSYHGGNMSASKKTFATDNLYELNAGSENPSASGSASEWSLQSFFGRVNYNFAERYLFEANIRYDGSSRMPKDHRYAAFPSVSAGWILSDESWMPELGPVSFLKFRGSWGLLGNQEIGNYAYSPTLGTYNYYFGNKKYVGLAENVVANDKIRWETTQVIDFGIDAKMFNNKVDVTFDYFNKLTSDILLRLNMPWSYTGTLSAPYQNVGKVRNTGFELSVNYSDRAGDFFWNVGANLSHVKNTIVDNGGVDDIGGSTINTEGSPIGSYYGLHALGIYQTEADLKRTNSKGAVIKQNGTAPALGDIMYDDINDDGNITDEDRLIIGNPFPKFEYSFNLSLGWKNIDITTFWLGVAGISRFNAEQVTISQGGNMSTRWLDRWSETNTDGTMPKLGNDFNGTTSDFWLEKADYFRLKNIELGYSFSNRLLDKIKVASARVFLQGTNLLTFTGFENYDPEKAASDMDLSGFPNVKSVSVGVNVRF